MSTDQPGDLDRTAARAMWQEYADAAGRPFDEEFTVERFGDNAALADALLGLVLAGTKRATAGLVADVAADGEPLPRIGGHLDRLRRRRGSPVRPPVDGAPPRSAAQRR